MLISPELNAAMNEEIGRELFASNQYVAIAAYFDGRALKKLAGMFYKQAEEEREHGMKFVHYLNDVDGKVAVPAVDAPKHEFATVEEAVKLSLDWELEVTARINDLMNLAVSQKDHMAHDFLRWFITEQREEVQTMDNLLKVVQSVGERNIIMVEAYLVHGG